MIQPHFERPAALSDLENIRHGFFGRRGAADNALGLDMSESLGGDPARIAANRRAALTALGAGHMALATLRQVHGADVVTLSEPPAPTSRPEADGLVTNLPKIALGILTADCAPVLFADSEAGVIGACHAGWRSAVSGILENTLRAMIALGARSGHTIATIGPTVSGANYEVGPEFAASLHQDHPAAARHIFLPGGATREHFDLPGFVGAELHRLDVRAVEQAGDCTFANPERYFSHRHHTQQGSPAGRQISLIALIT